MNWQETKQILKNAGIENLPDSWQRYIDLRYANLSYANLSGANLRYADLSGANLSGANLRYADLSGANLSGANLSDANLSGANLSGANLSDANLSDANLSYANLSGANLRYADLSGANLRYADLSGANLSGANLSGANLSDANLFGTILEDKSKALRRALRECHQPNGGLILYRTKRSQHVGSTVYEAGHTYTANALSLCPVTDCHPGIYGLPLSQIKCQYPDCDLVRIYVPYGEWHFVSEEKGFRCRRVRVLKDVN